MRSKTVYILLICLLLAIAVRSFIFLNTDHLDFESVFRVHDSYQFADKPFKLLWGTEIIHSGAGGQKGYYFLNSLIMHFIDRPVGVAKMSSFIFGAFSIIAYYFLIRLCFSNGIAMASAFMLSFYPLHVQLSVVPMANSGCIFFTIVSLYFLIKYLHESVEKRRKIYFLTALVFTILATSFRIEAWILIALYPFFILRAKNLKASVLFFILSSLYVASIFYIFYEQQGDPVSFLRNPVFSTSEFKGGHFTFIARRPEVTLYVKYKIFLWIKIIAMTFSLPLTILAFLGMVFVFRRNNKDQHRFLLIFWIFFILSTLRYIITEHAVLTRYSAMMGVFFIPFVFMGGRYTVERLLYFVHMGYSHRKVVVTSCSVAISLYYAFFSTGLLIKEIPQMKYDTEVHNLADVLNRRLRSGDIAFSSFNTLHLFAAELINKFCEAEELNNTILEKEKLDKISFLSDRFNSIARENGVYCNLLFKRGEPRKPGRLIFILDSRDYVYLKENLPDIFKKLEINRERDFAYVGVLPIDRL